MPPPNLFLIGAQKGGSTKLFAYLEQHPEIATLGSKEPNIFCAESESDCRMKLGLVRPDSDSYRFLIDGSVNYARHPRFSTVAKYIHALCDREHIRFLYILRDPVDRLISNYFWNRDRYGEHRPLLDAVAQEPQYVYTGQYDRQIQAFLEYFDLNNFFFLRFDDFVADASAEVASVFQWLDLPAHEIAEVGRTGTETNKETTRTARVPFVNRLIWQSPRLRRAVNACLPHSVVRTIASGLSKPVARANIDDDTKRLIFDRYFSQSIENTARITGLDLQDWRRSHDPATT